MDKGKIICLLPKSPLPKKGRIGPKKWQNWYQGCVKAVKMWKHDSLLLITSSFESEGMKEIFYYESILMDEMGFSREDMFLGRAGYDTISQLNFTIKYSAARVGIDEIIIVWSCPEHFFRWPLIKSWLDIPRDLKISHKVVWFGIPRPMEFARDIVALPLIVFYKVAYRDRAKERFLKDFIKPIRKKRAEGKV